MKKIFDFIEKNLDCDLIFNTFMILLIFVLYFMLNQYSIFVNNYFGLDYYLNSFENCLASILTIHFILFASIFISVLLKYIDNKIKMWGDSNG